MTVFIWSATVDRCHKFPGLSPGKSVLFGSIDNLSFPSQLTKQTTRLRDTNYIRTDKNENTEYEKYSVGSLITNLITVLPKGDTNENPQNI